MCEVQRHGRAVYRSCRCPSRFPRGTPGPQTLEGSPSGTQRQERSGSDTWSHDGRDTPCGCALSPRSEVRSGLWTVQFVGLLSLGWSLVSCRAATSARSSSRSLERKGLFHQPQTLSLTTLRRCRGVFAFAALALAAFLSEQPQCHGCFFQGSISACTFGGARRAVDAADGVAVHSLGAGAAGGEEFFVVTSKSPTKFGIY